MKRNALIDVILMGFFLISTLVILVATVTDESKARNKFNELKKVVQTTALSAAKRFNELGEEVLVAQSGALAQIQKDPLGNEIKDNLIWQWQLETKPYYVKVELNNYEEDLFWYRLLNMATFNFQTISAKVNIQQVPWDHTDNFGAMLINGCNKDYEIGDTFTLLLNAYDMYADTDLNSFYALAPPGGGQSSFTTYKNMISKFQDEQGVYFEVDDNGDFIIEGENMTVSTVSSTSIENDIKQLSQAFDIKNFSSQKRTIALVDCGSTAENPLMKEILTATIDNIACSSNCCVVDEVSGETTCAPQCEDMNYGDKTFDYDAMDFQSTSQACNNTTIMGITIKIEEPDDYEYIIEY